MWSEVFGDSGETAYLEEERRLNADVRRQEKERRRKEREGKQYEKKYEDISFRKLYKKKRVNSQRKQQPQQSETAQKL